MMTTIQNSAAWAQKMNESTALRAEIARLVDAPQVNIGWDIIGVFDTWECLAAHGYLYTNYPELTPEVCLLYCLMPFVSLVIFQKIYQILKSATLFKS